MAENNDRTYQVGVAVASLATGLFQPPLPVALRESWVPGTTVTRYRRTWYLARIHDATTYAVTGQIGFVGENSVETLFFDYSVGDFIKSAAPSGTLVPFAIRLDDGVIAYQLRPGLVREASFTGALQALLNASANPYVWTVEQAVEARKWAEWLGSVDRVTSFNIRVERPNPHYGQNRIIEGVIEGIHLEYLRLSGQALEGGVDTGSNLFRQAVDHVLRDYGRAAIHGVDTRGEESTWVKVRGMLGSVTSRVRVRASGDPDIPESELVSVLQKTPSVDAAADLGGLGDEREEE